MTAPPHVCVIGAGIVGSASALALARAGWRVTVVDAQSRAGQLTSLANGAQLSYSYVEPLATPQALVDVPAWLMKADSPVRWRPRLQWAHARWLFDFTRACNWAQVRRTTEALLALSFLSRDTLHAWLADLPESLRATLHHAQPGKLVLYRNAAKRQAVQRQLQWQSLHGCRQRLVEADECLALEPALTATGGGAIAFGVWTEDEEVVDAAALSQALVQASGASTLFGQRATGFELQRGRIVSLRLAGGDRVAADHFVLATGPKARELLQPLGLPVPIEPIKGYSITLPIQNEAAAPRASITDQGRRVVHARLGNSLRTAGFAELVGFDTSLNARRIQALREAVEATFPGACRFDDPKPWAGLRPSTPTGLPITGATRYGNLWLNLGHGGLGLTLAAGSAARLAGNLGPPLTPRPAARQRTP